MGEDSFFQAFMLAIRKNRRNNYTDNYDYYRFKASKKKVNRSKWLALKIFIKKRLNRLLLNKRAEQFLEPYRNGLEIFYSSLGNRESQELLVQLIAYRFLGFRRVKLPLNTTSFWHDLEQIHANLNERSMIKTESGAELYLFDLTDSGYQLRLYEEPQTIHMKIGLNHYQYYQNKFKVTIGVSPGDSVIDAGACYGDTALLFKYLTGSGGHVYSFEFLPAHIDVFNKNLGLNPTLGSSISLLQRALWDQSGLFLNYLENGTASKVVSDHSARFKEKTVQTVTLDELVESGEIPGVDFIKMDIEGAELRALKGAEATLRYFKPKLAISLYHNLSDFVTIPQYIMSLDLGYKLYLDHFTIHNEETVLFGVAG